MSGPFFWLRLDPVTQLCQLSCNSWNTRTHSVLPFVTYHPYHSWFGQKSLSVFQVERGLIRELEISTAPEMQRFPFSGNPEVQKFWGSCPTNFSACSKNRNSQGAGSCGWSFNSLWHQKSVILRVIPQNICLC